MTSAELIQCIEVGVYPDDEEVVEALVRGEEALKMIAAVQDACREYKEWERTQETAPPAAEALWLNITLITQDEIA